MQALTTAAGEMFNHHDIMIIIDNTLSFSHWAFGFTLKIDQSCQFWPIFVLGKKICTVWKFQNFLSLRFYVKSILENLQALNFVCLVNFSLQKVQKFRSSMFCIKSILENLEVLKVLSLPFLGLWILHFVNLVTSTLKKGTNS